MTTTIRKENDSDIGFHSFLHRGTSINHSCYRNTRIDVKIETQKRRAYLHSICPHQHVHRTARPQKIFFQFPVGGVRRLQCTAALSVTGCVLHAMAVENPVVVVVLVIAALVAAVVVVVARGGGADCLLLLFQLELPLLGSTQSMKQ